MPRGYRGRRQVVLGVLGDIAFHQHRAVAQDATGVDTNRFARMAGGDGKLLRRDPPVTKPESIRGQSQGRKGLLFSRPLVNAQVFSQALPYLMTRKAGRADFYKPFLYFDNISRKAD